MQRLAHRGGFLATKVGRRTLANFLTAAMLPVMVSSLTGIWYVRTSLESEAADRVQRTSKSVAMTVINRLNGLAERVSRQSSPTERSSLTLSRDDSLHLAHGKPLLRLEPTAAGEHPSMSIFRQLDSGRIVASTTSARTFWSALDENADLDRTAVCLFEVGNWQRVFCSPDVSEARATVLRHLAMSGELGDDAFLVARRDVYLRFELGAAEWRLITSESRAAALAPARTVTTSLLLLIGIALVSAFMFAHRQIRRSTEPLEALHSATRRVQAGDLATPVLISTRDEYSDLGAAFNGMTGALSRQLNLLQRMDAVDDATLRGRQVDAIAQTALRGLAASERFLNPSVAIRNDSVAPLGLTQWWTDGSSGHVRTGPVVLTERDRHQLLAHPRVYRTRANAPSERMALASVLPDPAGARVVVPLLHDGEVLGAITFEIDAADSAVDDEVAAIRRIADRVALGVANVQLLAQLDAMSTGTLRAFARAIDANSAWTRGHSERVTQLAMALAQSLALSPGEQSTLYRGGLMHDIGKLGIPATILEKAGKLTPEERIIIERHPEIGERILVPVPGFADALPIVRSHHERFDGRGYPDQLAGEQIPWLARVLAVADVFDALVSDRPYRAGLSHRAAIAMIESDSGAAFDPRVVDALLRMEYSEVLTREPGHLLEEFSVAGLVALRMLTDSDEIAVQYQPLTTV